MLILVLLFIFYLFCNYLFICFYLSRKIEQILYLAILFLFVVNCATMVIQIEVEKQEEHTQSFLRGLAVCLHPRKQQVEFFTITEIGLHKRVFIITLDITKLKKYLYNLNIRYRSAWASPRTPNLLFRLPNKEDMLEG